MVDRCVLEIRSSVPEHQDSIQLCGGKHIRTCILAFMPLRFSEALPCAKKTGRITAFDDMRAGNNIQYDKRSLLREYR